MSTGSPRSGPSRWASGRTLDAGMVGGVEAVALGLLVFVFGTLLVVNTWGVIDAKLAATAAAREATRAFVEAPSADAAWSGAERAARQTIAGHGRDPDPIRLAAPGAELRRCALVTMEVTIPIHLVAVPLVRGPRVMDVTGRHRERVDALRAGLPGEAEC